MGLITPKILSDLDLVLKDFPLRIEAPLAHADVVQWARDTNMDARVVGFLAQRGDCAGGSVRAWSQTSAVMGTEFYRLQDDETRDLITRGMLGDKAHRAYSAWLATTMN